MEKSILEMVGGVKHINPHYDIKANSSCYNINEGFTGIEVNGVRFSNIGEMLRYMNKQREQLIKAKEIIEELSKSLFLAKGIVRDLIDDTVDFKESKERAIYCYNQEKFDTYKEAVQFLKELSE